MGIGKLALSQSASSLSLLLVQLIFFADGVCNVIWQRPESDSGKSSAHTILSDFFRFQFRETTVFDEEKIFSLLQTQALCNCNGLHQLISILCLADRFCKDITHPALSNIPTHLNPQSIYDIIGGAALRYSLPRFYAPRQKSLAGMAALRSQFPG